MSFLDSKLGSIDHGTMVGVLTAAGVYLIYNNALPTSADIAMNPAHDQNIETERKKAAIESALLVGLVFLVSRDINSYMISGLALFGIDAIHKHANAVNPETGKVDTYSANSIDTSAPQNVYSLPDYDTGS